MRARCEARRGNPEAGIAPAPGGLYRPRNARASPLWQCAKSHARELRDSGRLRRAVEGQVIERFIECGDPHHGFARIYCDACGHDYLLAYSCKTRYFCPSCHQKRDYALNCSSLQPPRHIPSSVLRPSGVRIGMRDFRATASRSPSPVTSASTFAA
ncbi:MAG: transposase zinc-binding domain-containing protein [Terriglobales bacterium]